MIPQYTPSEMVRLELLQYENPEGLHPIQEQWRDLCKKIIEHVVEADRMAMIFSDKVNNKQYLPEHIRDYKPFKFPPKFTVKSEE